MMQKGEAQASGTLQRSAAQPADRAVQPHRGRMRGRWLRAALLASLLSSTHVLAAEPNEANEAQAKVHYQRALDLYNDGAFDAALVELNRAWELFPSYKLIYNVAQVQGAMRDYASALTSYRRYLAEGGDEIPAQRRAAVEKQLQTLAQRVATLQIVTEGGPAEIWIDDILVGKTPELESVLVNAGTRVISVRRSGQAPLVERLSVLGGTTRRVAFSVSGDTAVSEPVAPPAPQNAATTPMTPVADAKTQQHDAAQPGPVLRPLMGWVATGLVAVGATATGVAALSASNKLEDQRKIVGLRATALKSQADDVATLALVSDVLWVTTALGAGASLWWTLSERQSERETVALQLSVTPGALWMSGSF